MKLPFAASLIVACGAVAVDAFAPHSASGLTSRVGNRATSNGGGRVGASVTALSVARPLTPPSSSGRLYEPDDNDNDHDDDGATPSPAAAFSVRSVSLAQASSPAAGEIEPYSLFESLLTSGGDDRTLLDPATGRNRYHIRPRPINTGAGDIFRGSCTGNPPTERGYGAARRLYEELFSPLLDNKKFSPLLASPADRALFLSRLSGNLSSAAIDDAVRSVMSDQRSRIAGLLDLPDGAEVVLCPSGSDAEYIPLAIARTLMAADRKGQKKIANGVTQFREVGAGTSIASVGRYFSATAPLLGNVPGFPQASEPSSPPPHLTGFGPDVVDEGRSRIVPARRKEDGTAEAAANEMARFVAESIRTDDDDGDRGRPCYPIVHGVFGGKTGLRDPHCSDMPRVAGDDGAAGSTSLSVVDACQGRFTSAELRSWLSRDSLVLFTASKFYQGPPFSGAVILPGSIAKRLSGVTAEDLREECGDMFAPDGLGAFLTDKELPDCLESWRSLLRPARGGGRSGGRRKPDVNVGLTLRWEAGLAGMEALADVSDDDRDAVVEEWAGAVTDAVRAEGRDLLDVWWVERSIVSVRVAAAAGKKGGDDGRTWMGMDDLRKLFGWMGVDVSGRVAAADDEANNDDMVALSKIAYIGQPVDVCDDHGIVRIALGAESMLSYTDDPVATLEEDRWVIRKIAAIAKHFDALDGWGERTKKETQTEASRFSGGDDEGADDDDEGADDDDDPARIMTITGMTRTSEPLRI